MRKYIYLFILVALYAPSLFAQYNTPQNRNWVFGTRAGVNFPTGAPSAFSSSISTSEGSASVSNAAGNLLFYTDGRTVWNRTHSIMTSGTTISSFTTSSSSQSSLIVPVIGNNNEYYVFSLELAGGTGGGFCRLIYCKVDMSMSGGLGAVVSSTIGTALHSNMAEKICAIKGNNCNIWVLTHLTDSNTFLAYNITATGISGPVVSTVGRFMGRGSYGAYGIGVMKASPDGTKVVTASYSPGTSGAQGVQLFDFNATSGVVSNCRVLDSTNSAYGAEFSPNSNMLYTSDVASGARVMQWDISSGAAATIIASRYTVATGTGYPQINLGPDSNIYMIGLSSSSFLDAINDPNISGSGCNYAANVITLSSGTRCVYGLPTTVVVSPNADSSFARHDTMSCIPINGSIRISSHFTDSTYTWLDSGTTQTRLIDRPGTYICASSTGCILHIDTIVVAPYTPSLIRIRHDTTICALTSGMTLSGRSGYPLYAWNTGATTRTLAVTAAGNYSIRSYDSCLNSIIDTYIVVPYTPTQLNVRHDTSICSLINTINLSGRVGYPFYTWSTGATTRTIGVTTPNTYWIRAFDSCLNSITDTFQFTKFPPDTTVRAIHDTAVCVTVGTITLMAPPGGYTSYRWSTGSTASTLTVGTTGTYYLYSYINCSIFVDTFHVTFIPQPRVNIGNDTAFCIGGSIVLAARQPVGYSKLWSTGSLGDTIHVGSSGTYWLRVDNGCIVTDSIHVLVSPFPVVDLGPDLVNCTGTPFTLASSVTYTSPTYAWNTGDITPSITVTSSGTYWEQVTVAGCSSADTIHVDIYFDTLRLFNLDTAICKGQFVLAMANINPAANCQWVPTAGIALSTSANTNVRPDTTTTYRILVYLASCPVISDSFTIDVQPNPAVYLGGNKFACQYDTLHLTAHAEPEWYGRYSYHWTPATYLDDTTARTVIFKPGATTKYIVEVKTPRGCVGYDSTLITVSPGDFAVVSADTSVCPHQSIKRVVSGGDTYRWLPSRYVSDSTSDQPTIMAISNTTYKVIATSAAGCNDTVSTTITVFPNAVISMIDTIQLYPGESFHIQPLSNCTMFSWFPTTGLSNASIIDPVINLGSSTVYTLTGTTTDGCATTSMVHVDQKSESIFNVPNVFTPGSGVNNTFRLLKRGMGTLMYFRIYNRWGNIVFETKNVDEGWDGAYQGAPQPLGVYIYEIRAVSATGAIWNKTGNVTLVR